MGMITARIAQMVLHVPDDRVVPVKKIDRAIRTSVNSGRTKIRILGCDEILQCFAAQSGTFLAYLHAKNSLDADDVTVQKIMVEFVGKVPAADKTSPRTWPGGAFPKLLHSGVFACIEMAAERWRKIVSVAGRIGDDVVTPIIKDASVRIGKTV